MRRLRWRALYVRSVVTIALATAALTLRLFGANASARILRRIAVFMPFRRTSNAPLATARALTATVDAIAMTTPGKPRCLVRSLVVQAMLARRGIESSVVLGVRMDEGFDAHAWIDCDGQAIDERNVTARYKVIGMVR